MKQLLVAALLAISLVSAVKADYDYVSGGYAASDAIEWANSHGMQGAAVIGCKYNGNGAIVRCVLAKKFSNGDTDTVEMHCNGNVKVGRKCVQTGFKRFVFG